MPKSRGPLPSAAALRAFVTAARRGSFISAAEAPAALALAAGRLVRPVPESVPAEFAYRIASRLEHAQTPAVARFRDRLLAQARGQAVTPPSPPPPAARPARIPAR